MEWSLFRGVTAALACTFLFACDGLASEIHVPDDYPTIQVAINAAADGDTIIVSPGRYIENIDFLGKAITVRSIDPLDQQIVESTIIDGGGARSCVRFKNNETNDSLISGFTITNGNANGPHPIETCGGGIYCGGRDGSSPVISFNIIRDNSAAHFGGGIDAGGGSPIILSNTIKANTAAFGGGIDAGGGSLIILSNTIKGNTAGSGGGICSSGLAPGCHTPVFIVSNTIEGNMAGVGGGISADANDNEETVILGNSISENRAKFSGGGLGGQCVIVQENLFICNSSGSDGGGAKITYGGSSQLLAENLFSGNVSGHNGGALALSSSILTMLVSGNTMADNTSTGTGSAIFTMSNCTAYDNVISGNTGAGAALHDVPEVLHNVIVGNPPFGIYTGRSSSRIEDNMIYDNGIAVRVDSNLRLRILNNVIIGNSIGLELRDNRNYGFIAGNTIVGNQLAMMLRGPTLPLFDCIVGSSGAPAIRLEFSTNLTVKSCLIEGGIDSIVVSDTAQVTWGPGNIDADPLFVDPGHWDDAGTPSDPSDDSFILGDYHLLPGSPCIDAGTNNVDNPDTPVIETLPATDIAGVPRVIDGNLDGTATVDIGAYEYLPGDVNYDGKVNVLDLILVRNSLGRDPASSLEARKADVNADGSVNVLDLLIVRGRLGR